MSFLASSPPTMRVESLSPTEFDAAIALWHEAGLTRPWNNALDDLRRAVAGPSSTVLAGHDGHRGWVYYVAVRPDRRGQGRGRAIMRACESWLSTRDVPKLDLMIRTENDAVIAFYEALGYRHDDVVVMSKRLH